MADRRGMGRGLGAILPESASGPDMRELPVDSIDRNPDQPRTNFSSEALEALAESIRASGVVQPLIVRPAGRGKYEIIAGERRWRAAQMANLHSVPVLIRDLDDGEVIEIAIIENIQRANLNAVEEAQGFRQLMDRFGHTQEKLSEVLGKSRSHIANLLRLLTLPDEVLGYLRDGKLTAGHARALVPADDPAKLARQIIGKGLSVRQAEKLAKPADHKSKNPSKVKAGKDADTKALEDELARVLGMKTELSYNSANTLGVLSITFESLDQLDELCRLLMARFPDATR